MWLCFPEKGYKNTCAASAVALGLHTVDQILGISHWTDGLMERGELRSPEVVQQYKIGQTEHHIFKLDYKEALDLFSYFFMREHGFHFWEARTRANVLIDRISRENDSEKESNRARALRMRKFAAKMYRKIKTWHQD